MKPVASTAFRTLRAVRGLSNGPSGAMPSALFLSSNPMTPACRASIVTIDSATARYAGFLMLNAWPE